MFLSFWMAKWRLSEVILTINVETEGGKVKSGGTIFSYIKYISAIFSATEARLAKFFSKQNSESVRHLFLSFNNEINQNVEKIILKFKFYGLRALN